MDDFTAFVGEVVGSEAPRINEHLPTRSQEPPRMTRKRPSKAVKASSKGKAKPVPAKRRSGAVGGKKKPQNDWEKETKERLQKDFEPWLGSIGLKPEAEARVRKKWPDYLAKACEEMVAIRAEKAAGWASLPPPSQADRQAAEAECDALGAVHQQEIKAGKTPEGLLAEDAAIQSAFASIMNRCAAENLAGDIARHETKEVFFEMLDAIFQAAQKNPNLQGPAWAGRLLAEVLLALKKNSPILERNPAFAARYSKTQSYKFTPSAFWPWIERAYQRMNFVLEASCGLHPLTQISSDEQGIPAVLDRIHCMGKDEAAKEMFEKIIWPIIQSFESEIREETWFEERAKNAKGARAEKRNANLSNLKEDFKDVWKVFFDRPAGRLSRIERPD